MITRGIREFMSRDWRALRASKDTYWGERIARLGPIEGLRIADELRRQVVLADPTWPDESLRREDLRFHVRLAELFRRAAPRQASGEPAESSFEGGATAAPTAGVRALQITKSKITKS